LDIPGAGSSLADSGDSSCGPHCHTGLSKSHADTDEARLSSDFCGFSRILARWSNPGARAAGETIECGITILRGGDWPRRIEAMGSTTPVIRGHVIFSRVSPGRLKLPTRTVEQPSRGGGDIRPA
jgi:hypothetical protein